MKTCQFCNNPATVHLTDIINKTKREVHLCENCAREHNLIPEAQQELNIPALLQFLTGQPAAVTAKSDLSNLACPHCGIKYAQFRVQGRLGCPEDYEVFHAALEPLLERIHRHTRHQGKIPAGRRARSVGLDARRDRPDAQRLELLEQLEQAVREERYEDAAHLRDRIRSMGTADES